MLLIDLRSLDAGYHEFSLQPTAEDIGIDPDAFRDILVEVGLEYGGKTALVNITASAIATLVCDRTLVPFDQAITGDYTLLFTSDETEDDDIDEVRSLSVADEELDISDVVRDTLVLAIPVRKVAPGAEDVSIPVAFGKTDDVDPRWEALKALKKNDGDDSERHIQ